MFRRLVARSRRPRSGAKVGIGGARELVSPATCDLAVRHVKGMALPRAASRPGGGALLRGFDKLLSEETGLPVHVAEDPLSAVAEGTGKCLNELKFLRQVASADRQWR